MRSKNYLFFAGKGGVGKTTCSVAYSLKSSEKGLSTLVVSTDPAHSISHLLETELSEEPTEIKTNLYAKEIDPKKEAKNHKKKIMEEMRQVVSHDKISSVKGYLELAHNSPGVIESAMLDAIIDTIKEDEFERIVFDTAPTGQTMRLLQLPELLDSWSNRLIKRRRKDLERLKNVEASEKLGDSLIEKLKERRDKLRYGRDIIVNQSSLIPVMTPEKLSLKETKEIIRSLEALDIDVPGIIVNKLSRHLEKRKKYEKEIIEEIEKKLNKEILGKIPRMDKEAIGLSELKKIAGYIEIQ